MDENLVELFKDEAIAKEFAAQPTVEDAQRFLASKGVQISADEVEKLGKMIAFVSDTSEEVSDEQLAQVAGGASTYNVANIIKVAEIFKRYSKFRR